MKLVSGTHLSKAIREVVFVISDHRVPAVHQQPPPGPLPCPERDELWLNSSHQSSRTKAEYMLVSVDATVPCEVCF